MTFQEALKRESISPSMLFVNEMRDALLVEGGMAVTVRSCDVTRPFQMTSR